MSPILKRNRSVFFEPLAGGGALARPPNIPQSCDCWRGKVYLDFKTNERVGHQRFFFDEDERAYYLDNKRLTQEQAEKIDRASTPEYWIDPRYVGTDGLIRGASTGYEWCDLCERKQRAKLAGVRMNFWIESPSGHGRYWFEFPPDAPSHHLTAFVESGQLFRPRSNKRNPRSDKQLRELIIWCLLYFRRYASIPNCTERALARRFRVSRGRIRSIRIRFRRRLEQSAVPKQLISKPTT